MNSRSGAITRAAVPLLLAALAIAPTANAEVTARTGSVRLITQPANARTGAFESPTFLRVWNEAQSVRLTQPLRVNEDAQGRPGTIPAGTWISSHLLHADQPGTTGERRFSGTVTFARPIIGVIRWGRLLAASDVFALPTAFDQHGRELDNHDSLSFSGRTLTAGFISFNQADEVRVITEADPKPPVRIIPDHRKVGTIALRCTKRDIVLQDVLRRHGRVRLFGYADPRYAGRTVQFVLTGTGRRVARTRLRADGTFLAFAPLPPRSIRGTNRARYRASVAGERSQRLKLTRRIAVHAVRSGGRRVGFVGRVVAPLAKPPRALQVRRRLACGRWRVVARVRLQANGRFNFTVAAPPTRETAVYRLVTRVPARRARRDLARAKTFRTFTLPRVVDFR